MRFRGLNIALFVAAVLIPGSIVYALLDLPYKGLALTLGVMSLVFWIVRWVESGSFIDIKLTAACNDQLGSFSAYSRSLPDYRFVDLYRAAAAIVAEREGTRIASEHKEPLALIVAGTFYGGDETRVATTPQQVSKSVAHGEEAFFPTDGFWIVRVGVSPEAPPASSAMAIIRVRIDPYLPRVNVEVAAATEPAATALIDAIVERAKTESIYKNRVIELVFSGVRDETGELATSGTELIFRAPSNVSGDELVLPAVTRAVIERNIITFHELRSSLLAVGVPAKKGVLFYGPPGTGKTFTCKYLASRLGITTIIVAGQSLLHVKSICNLARMLQPALVILEDVDLVFSERETNPFSTSLGDLMDELDGFGAVDQLTFILTTNDIDRVERAIKDRPGRVSQCVEFECPSAQLRESYLRRLVATYDHTRVGLDTIVRKTEGASQAFLKELVYRAVQLSLERTASKPTKPADVVLVDSDLAGAFDELTSGSGHAGRGIVGFGKR